MKKLPTGWVRCERCGGATKDLEKHKWRPSCRLAAHKKHLESLGLVRAGYEARLLRGSKVGHLLRRAPIAINGLGRMTGNDVKDFLWGWWAPAWVVSVANKKLTGMTSYQRRALINAVADLSEDEREGIIQQVESAMLLSNKTNPARLLQARLRQREEKQP